MAKAKTKYSTLMHNLEQMKFIEKRYLHNDEFSYDVYGKVLDCYTERYDRDEDELKEAFKNGEVDIDFFLDDYLTGLLAYLKFEDEITSPCLGDTLHPFIGTMIVRFIIARYYGLHIQFNNEYLAFRDKLNDKELDEFYAQLTSHGIEIDSHTLIDVEFD